MRIDWTTFKGFVTARSLSIQWIDIKDHYYMKAFDGAFELECVMSKEESPSSDQTDFETNFKAKGNKSLMNINQPFAAKILPNGKKLYTRVHGVATSVSGAPDNIDFVVPYDNCKLTGIEIIGGLIGDKCNLKILDTPTGTISGIANSTLNQFGYDVNVSKDFFRRESAYDADLIKDLKIRVEYDSIATLPADIYINFVLHEVKD